MAKKPAAKPDDQPEQKIQLVTPDFKPPHRGHDEGIELYRRIMDGAKARGDLVHEEHAGRALGMLLESLIALDSIPGPSPRKRGLSITTDEWGVSRLNIHSEHGLVELCSAKQGISRLVRLIAEVLGQAVVPSTVSNQVVKDVLGIDGHLREKLELAEKTLPSTAGDVVNTTSTDIMRADEFAKQFAEVAPYLNEKHLAAILEKARHDARIGRFLAEINASDNRPGLYRDKPGWMSLPEFLKTEWLAKGWLRDDVDRQMVEAYDDGLLRGIINFEANHGRLPDDLQFKVLRQRQAKADNGPKKSKVLKK